MSLWRLSLPLLQHVLLIPFVCAFTWPSTAGSYVSTANTAIISQQDDFEERVGETFLAGRASFEDAAQLRMTHEEPFGVYFHRTDCFQRAAKIVRKRCGELHFDEQERVGAAISMTLCEIATATHHTVPLECTTFTTGNDPGSITIDPRLQGQCVDALSRSAQFWSSYSGYLREIPQLCFAFRKSEDIDLARDIYRNSSLEHITFLHSLKNQEKQMEGNLRRWESQLSDLQFAIIELQLAAFNIDKTVNDSESRSRENMLTTQSQIHSLVSEGSHRLYEAGVLIGEQVDMKLSAAFMHHEAELQGHVTALEARLFQTIESGSVQVGQRNENMLRIANEVTARWTDVNFQFTEFQQSLEHLSRSINRAAVTLDKSSHQSEVAYQQQLKATAETSSLIEAMGQLREATSDQLNRINESATSIRQHLIAEKHVSHQWLKEFFLGALNTVVKVEPIVLDHILGLPVLRLLLSLSYGIISVIRLVISGLLSLVVVLFVTSRQRPKKKQIIDSAMPMDESRVSDRRTSAFIPCTFGISCTTGKPLDRDYSRLTRGRAFRIPERLCRGSDS